jgi:hypothetical protein
MQTFVNVSARGNMKVSREHNTSSLSEILGKRDSLIGTIRLNLANDLGYFVRLQVAAVTRAPSGVSVAVLHSMYRRFGVDP